MANKNKDLENIDKTIEEFEEHMEEPILKSERISVRFDKVLSTGSTLLDLAISGKRVRGGGIPGGIIVEIFGPPGTGKTAILAEVAASSQLKGGEVVFCDPEARLDQEYARIYGMTITKENYNRPNTVNELFDIIWGWKTKDNSIINVSANDSLASLSTEMEMESQDKMGMKRAKDFSANLRKTCRMIANNNWLLLNTNQIRQGDHGFTTSGGNALPHYASLRIQLKSSWRGSKLVKTVKLDSGKEVDKVIGIQSEAFIYKSSLDDPFRSAPVYILFDIGIDDIRANLQWIKDMTKDTTYDCFDKRCRGMEQAIHYIEENDLEDKLREKVINMWNEIENKFNTNRKKKVRR